MSAQPVPANPRPADQRKDLHPLEEAEAYQRLMNSKYDVARIAERVGRSVAYVYDRVKLLNLTEAAQKAFRDGEFSAGHAVILARLSPADQKRAMESAGGLFEDEGYLFTPEKEKKLKPWSRKAADAFRKARSVRELQAWVDKHTKIEPDQVDPMLFPETARVLQDATAHEEKVVRVTYDVMTPEEVRGGKKVILGRSWKRADGQHGSKQCDRSVIGQVVIGAGRGQALRVCTDKKRCTVHWGDLIKSAKKREKEVSKAAKTGEDREALRRAKEAEEAAKRKADFERWKKARPNILNALATSLALDPAGPGTPLGQVVINGVYEDMLYGDRKVIEKHLPTLKSAEDLVRQIGFGLLMRELPGDSYYYGDDPTGRATRALKPFVDVSKYLEPVAAGKPKPKAKRRA